MLAFSADWRVFSYRRVGLCELALQPREVARKGALGMAFGECLRRHRPGGELHHVQEALGNGCGRCRSIAAFLGMPLAQHAK